MVCIIVANTRLYGPAIAHGAITVVVEGSDPTAGTRSSRYFLRDAVKGLTVIVVVNDSGGRGAVHARKRDRCSRKPGVGTRRTGIEFPNVVISPLPSAAAAPSLEVDLSDGFVGGILVGAIKVICKLQCRLRINHGRGVRLLEFMNRLGAEDRLYLVGVAWVS